MSGNFKDLYDTLGARFGKRADPARWWPVYHARTDPPTFERVITGLLAIVTVGFLAGLVISPPDPAAAVRGLVTPP